MGSLGFLIQPKIQYFLRVREVFIYPSISKRLLLFCSPCFGTGTFHTFAKKKEMERKKMFLHMLSRFKMFKSSYIAIFTITWRNLKLNNHHPNRVSGYKILLLDVHTCSM